MMPDIIDSLYDYHSDSTQLYSGHYPELVCPNKAYYYAISQDQHGPINRQVERAIAKSALCSYNYAWYLNGRFLLGEPIIATDKFYSMGYAENIIKGRFELAESIIATSGCDSFNYAIYILKERFLLGERSIERTSSYYCREYNTLFGTKLVFDIKHCDDFYL